MNLSACAKTYLIIYICMILTVTFPQSVGNWSDLQQFKRAVKNKNQERDSRVDSKPLYIAA